MKNMRSKSRYLLLLILLIPILAYAKADKAPSEEELKSDKYKYLEIFAKAYEITKREYVEEISDKELIQSAINGMLSERDPHSGFLNEEDYEDMETSTTGKFGGLGIVVTMDKGVVKVISPIDDTPAAKAGVKSGDLITHIDDEQVQGLSLNDAVKKMRGPKGTDIKIRIFREGEDPFTVKLTRDIINVEAVKTEKKDDKVGYIRITSFNKNTYSELKKAIKEIKDELGENLVGYVLDLRNNPGGLLTQAAKVSDAFLNEGEIVTTRARDPKETDKFFAKEGDLAEGKPIVTIINGGSASASEIVAGALQDHRRSVLIGTKSFGKGSVQTLIPITKDDDGDPETALRITTARYYTPSGRSIQSEGIEPDVVVAQVKLEKPEDDKKDWFSEKTLHNALKNDTKNKSDSDADGEESEDDKKEADYQLIRAIDLAKSLAIYNNELPRYIKPEEKKEDDDDKKDSNKK